MDPKYQKTIIYIITCNNTSVPDCYIGSTTNFNARKRAHKFNCHNEKDKIKYNYPIYKFIRANGGLKNFAMQLLYEFSCDNIQAAILEERFWYELLGCTLNKQKPGRTVKEYTKDNKEKKAEYDKEHYETNREKILERKKEQVTCECGCVSARNHLPKHKRTQKHKKLMQAINEVIHN